MIVPTQENHRIIRMKGGRYDTRMVLERHEKITCRGIPERRGLTPTRGQDPARIRAEGCLEHTILVRKFHGQLLECFSIPKAGLAIAACRQNLGAVRAIERDV